MFAKKISDYQIMMLLVSIMLLSSCRQSTNLQRQSAANNPTPTASGSPSPTSPVATNSPPIEPIIVSTTPSISSPTHKQDRLNQQALAAVERQAYDTAISLFERSLANADSQCHKKYNQAWIKAAKKAKSWKVKTLESFALHGLTTTDKVIAKDQKEVFDESFENNLKGYKCDF